MHIEQGKNGENAQKKPGRISKKPLSPEAAMFLRTLRVTGAPADAAQRTRLPWVADKEPPGASRIITDIKNLQEGTTTRAILHESNKMPQPTFTETEERKGTKMVDMNQADILHAKPGERSAIATSGLGGCTAIVVDFEHPKDPTQKGAVVAHYDPMMLNFGVEKQQIKSLLTDVRVKGMRARALITSPGIGDLDSPTGYAPDPKQAERIAQLTQFIQSELGEGTPVKSIGYQAGDDRTYYQGTVLAEYPQDATGSPTILVGGVQVDMDSYDSSDTTDDEGYKTLRFGMNQQIMQERMDEPSSVLHERLRPRVVNAMNAVEEPTKIITPSWYTYDASNILPDVPNAVVVSTSTCKHELPNRLFVGQRTEGAWMETSEDDKLRTYKLQPLGRRLKWKEKNAIYDNM